MFLMMSASQIHSLCLEQGELEDRGAVVKRVNLIIMIRLAYMHLSILYT